MSVNSWRFILYFVIPPAEPSMICSPRWSDERAGYCIAVNNCATELGKQAAMANRYSELYSLLNICFRNSTVKLDGLGFRILFPRGKENV